MVKVREDYPLDESGQVDIPRWIERLPRLQEHGIVKAELAKAAEFAMAADNNPEEGALFWGVSYSRLLTGLEMAEILTELNLDQNTLVAAIIYRTIRDGVKPLQEARELFGDTVAQLIEGVLQMANIK